MNQIDTSVYGRMRRPSDELARLSQSLGGYAQNYRQGKMDNLQLQQQEIALANQRRKQEKQEDFTRRQKAYQDALALDPMMTPETRQDLESRIFQPELLEQRLRGGLRGGAKVDPFAERKMLMAEERARLAGQRLTLGQEAGIQKQQRLELAIENQDWKQTVKLSDDIARDKAAERLAEDRRWTNEFKLNKGPREYAQVQGELLGQVTPMVRANYRGTAAESLQGKDLTPENIKVLTTATEGTSKILESTDLLLAMVEKHGKEVLPSEEKAIMQSLISDIGLTYKGTDFANLGVLNGPDLEILLKIMGDPTSLTTMPANQQKAKLSTFRDILLKGYNKKLDARGFDPLTPEQIISVGGGSVTTAISAENNSIADSIIKDMGIKD